MSNGPFGHRLYLWKFPKISFYYFICKSNLKSARNWSQIALVPIQNGPLRDCSRIGERQKGPLPKICHTYSAMMKFDTVIPYLNKIQKKYKSHDTLLEFCWHQHFFSRNPQLLLYREIQITLDKKWSFTFRISSGISSRFLTKGIHNGKLQFLCIVNIAF